MTRRFDIIKETAGGAVARPGEGVRLELLDQRSEPFGPYVLSSRLATTVNAALGLGQPLLVTGEPGCGKTSLAWAIADQLGTDVLEFHVKSTSVARDLLYTIDSLRRFHDAQAGASDARDAANYVTYQALGQAIQSDRTRVVLIDEVDKAPRDFPNDLLNELDRMEFKVPEITPAPHFKQKVQHFVLITSNSERRLPMPFLRRCVYAHLDFPDETMLRKIVELHARPPSTSFTALAVQRFLALRRTEGLVKPPATSELIAWTRLLTRMGIDEAALAKLPVGELPALETLIKMLDDLKRLRKG